MKANLMAWCGWHSDIKHIQTRHSQLKDDSNVVKYFSLVDQVNVARGKLFKKMNEIDDQVSKEARPAKVRPNIQECQLLKDKLR